MNDLTILYYTANIISEHFAHNIRQHLLSVIGDTPIVSISHKPIDFGHNIHVGRLQPLAYNIYRQILVGAYKAKTEYIACCEDDALYTKEHFAYRPKCGIGYNINRWNLNHDLFYFRNRAGMCMNISRRKMLIDILEMRFKKYPEIINGKDFDHFGEPGRSEKQLGLPKVEIDRFKSEGDPTVTFNHRPSLGGKRRLLSKDIIQKSLEPWGEASTLWDRFYNSQKGD